MPRKSTKAMEAFLMAELEFTLRKNSSYQRLISVTNVSELLGESAYGQTLHPPLATSFPSSRQKSLTASKPSLEDSLLFLTDHYHEQSEDLIKRMRMDRKDVLKASISALSVIKDYEIMMEKYYYKFEK